MPRPKKGQKTPGSGRKKGTPNKVTRVFAELVDESLFGDPKLTLKRLNELRDSDESQDRSTYWRVVGKRLPQLHEAKIETDRPLVVMRDYKRGPNREREHGGEEDEES